MTTENTNTAAHEEESEEAVFVLNPITIKPEQIKFRYFGDVGDAKSGIITFATVRDELNESVRVGVSLTPPGQKFDAEFARVIAMHRIPATTVEGGMLAERLAGCRERVQKRRTKVKLTEAEREEQRDRIGRSGQQGGAGYYRYEIEYYELSDFDPKPAVGGEVELFDDGGHRYGFVVDDVEADASHSQIDIAIAETFLFHRAVVCPGWVTGYIYDFVQAAQGDIEDESEVEYDENGMVRVTSLDTSSGLTNAVASVVGDEVFIISSDDSGDRAIASPIFESKERLIDWLEQSLIEVKSNGVTVTELCPDPDDDEDEFAVEEDEDADDEDEDSDDDAEEEDEDTDSEEDNK
jgi:hypothetical protein